MVWTLVTLCGERPDTGVGYRTQSWRNRQKMQNSTTNLNSINHNNVKYTSNVTIYKSNGSNSNLNDNTNTTTNNNISFNNKRTVSYNIFTNQTEALKLLNT